jgi:hypothetical protein
MQKVIAFLLIVVVALLGVLVNQQTRTNPLPAFSTPYQAVVLSNGQVYYGKLESAAGQYLILRDVFYITNQINPETKQSTSVFVRRGKELHGPEYMLLNQQSIIFAEPVKEDSQVAKLIAAQKSK